MAEQEVVVKFEAEVDGFRKDLAKVKKELKAIKGSTDGAQKGASGMAGKLAGSIGKQVAKFGGILAGAFAIQGIVTSAAGAIVEFDKAVASLSAITGATGKDLDFLKSKAIELGAASGLGASATAKAFELIGSAKPELLKSGAALADVTEQAILLSQASGLDLTSAANAVTTALNQFGLGAEESSRAVNILAAGAKEGASAIPETATALERFGAVASGANVTLEQSVGLVETLAEKQLTGAEAGTQLRNIILKLQTAGIGFVDGQFNIQAALTESKNKFESIESPIKRTQELTKLFGLESVTAANILLDNTDKVDKYTSAVTGTGVATEQARKNQDTLSFQTQQLGAAWEALVLSLEDGTGTLGKLSRSFIGGATALLKFLGATEDLTGGKLAEVQALEDTQAALGAELEILARANLSQEERADQINKINSEYGEYLPNLLDEKATIDDIRDAQEQANAAFVKRILLAEQQEELTKLAKIQAEQIKRNIAIRKEQALVLSELEELRSQELDDSSRIARSQAEAQQANNALSDSIAVQEQKLKDLNTELLLNNSGQGLLTLTTADLRKEYAKLIEELGIVTDETNNLDDANNKLAGTTAKVIKGEEDYQKELQATEQLIKLNLRSRIGNEEIAFERKLQLLDEEADRIRANSQLGPQQKALELAKIKLLEDKARKDKDKADKESEDKEKAGKRELFDAGVDLAAASATAITDIQNAQNNRATDAAIIALEKRLEAGLIKEEDFEKARAKLLTEQAEKAKKIAVTESLINTAVAITKALGSAPPPANFILAGAVGVAGGAQTALIASEPIPQFGKGGWIGGKPHTDGGTDINAEKDEFMVNKRDAKKNPELLENLNKGALDSYIQMKYVVPALMKQKVKQASKSNDLLGNSIALSLKGQKFTDDGLLASDKQTRRVLQRIENAIRENKDTKPRYHY